MTHRRGWVRARAVRGVGVVVVAAAAVGGALTACQGTSAQSGSAASAPDEVRSAVRTRLQALVTADKPTLQEGLADDYKAITPDGDILSRGEAVGTVASADIDYLSFEPVTDIEVRVHGDAAVVQYESRIDIVLVKVGRLRHEAWHTDLYERREGRWQVVWSQATAVGPLPTPQPTP
jgi:phage baseplate assembly protein W